MTDDVIDAIVLVAEEDSPEAAARQAAHEIGDDDARELVEDAADGAFGQRHDTLAAVLSALRQMEVEA